MIAQSFSNATITGRLGEQGTGAFRHNASMEISYRRLGPADAADFLALRMEGFVLHSLEFRIAPDDEAGMTTGEVAARLGRDFVTGAFQDGVLVGNSDSPLPRDGNPLSPPSQ